MFDAVEGFEDAGCARTERARGFEAGARSLVVAADAAAAARLRVLAGGAGAVEVIEGAALDAAWPAYVAARARTGGALLIEASAIDLAQFDADVLAEGDMFDQPAIAIVTDGALVFVIGGAPAELALAA